ncbi:MAG: hypothetical protein CVV64_07835 [Candidatus Wallbacteria bacterium HGW-Wallbacteria-1]|uniref:SHOCT domain-containing protein n=1 Tax=Candidatus Wallbacteria bacterium HGW-Wallbacteria-1 TaxID=2013854 RepID=A0A2N1PR13_9BACT|nr:MAG: hypothetical protein CVV64_07835 [Candidatus Wallbacteria bacterium HGW-Wallbacteria-1]
MKNEKFKEDDADRIIHSHVLYAMTGGAIPIPLADLAAVTAVQLDMLRRLAELYDVDFDKESARSLISAIVGATASKIGASMVKAIPGVGIIVGTGAQIILAGASTYALGHIFEVHFANKGDFMDVDTESMRHSYKDWLKKGQEYAKSLKKGGLDNENEFEENHEDSTHENESSREASSEKGEEQNDPFDDIRKLRELLDSGIIDKADFDKTKMEILERIARGK